MPSREFATPKCNEPPPVEEKSKLSKEDEAEVARLRKLIEDHLNESAESSWRQEYEFKEGGTDGKKIALVYVANEEEPFLKGPAALDVVTAYEKLLKQIEDEKSSKQQRHTV
ncbi:hypothetical protein J4E83_004661 [Alternaria metachromatica]|uniref:uncharacterized protein n=1 Tax=Alternaria metachromatica TaxID=283354 RepID=UPI0020C4AAF4|nr:uncharacterized protein J4E83_004661 [Alternaria metachromatica]KAI4623269.1 hypothetical protein J4E83_004661 [Alternaria metachromatica]